MMTDPLQQLLRNADVEAPRSSNDVATSVRQRYAKQRRNYRIASAAACLFAVASIAIALSLRREHPQVVAVAPPSVASIDDRIHEMTVAKLTTPKRRMYRSATPQADLQLQRDTAALILVYDAEQHAKQNRSADAVALYRRAIDLFPQTHWAQVARERLKEMQT